MSENTISTLEHYVCSMYGKRNIKNINEVRLTMFKENYSTKNDRDPLNEIKGMNPCSLPPCHQVLLNKTRRANYIGNIWKNAHLPYPSSNSPEENGWRKSDGYYAINWYDGDQLPQNIGDVLRSEVEGEEEEG